MKKSAFTLVETLVSLLIISAVGMASMHFISAYLKNTYERDMQQTAAISGISIVEELKAEVDNLPQLYSFIQGKDVTVTAVGIGEISLNPDGSYIVLNPEAFDFPDKLKSGTANLFRIDTNGEVANGKITTVVILR